MKKLTVLLVALVLAACNNQEKDNTPNQQKEQDTTVAVPQAQWNVKKEYDEFGNLVKYDSTYTWSYANKEGESLNVNLDSIMDSFKGYFGQNTPLNWSDDFFYFPKNDSLFMLDFFDEDYFYRSWRDQLSELDARIRRMDSSRNYFMKRYHPGLMESFKKE